MIEQAAPADLVVTFPDISEAITGPETREHALIMAEHALATAIEHHLRLGRPVPLPSSHADLPRVPLDPAIAARVLLTRAMPNERLGVGRALEQSRQARG